MQANHLKPTYTVIKPSASLSNGNSSYAVSSSTDFTKFASRNIYSLDNRKPAQGTLPFSTISDLTAHPLIPACNLIEKSETSSSADSLFPVPKEVLCPENCVKVQWNIRRGAGKTSIVAFGPSSLLVLGVGLKNQGNTCFLNSILQALTYTAPLFNYLIHGHSRESCALYIRAPVFIALPCRQDCEIRILLPLRASNTHSPHAAQRENSTILPGGNHSEHAR